MMNFVPLRRPRLQILLPRATVADFYLCPSASLYSPSLLTAVRIVPSLALLPHVLMSRYFYAVEAGISYFEYHLSPALHYFFFTRRFVFSANPSLPGTTCFSRRAVSAFLLFEDLSSLSSAGGGDCEAVDCLLPARYESCGCIACAATFPKGVWCRRRRLRPWLPLWV